MIWKVCNFLMRKYIENIFTSGWYPNIHVFLLHRCNDNSYACPQVNSETESKIVLWKLTKVCYECGIKLPLIGIYVMLPKEPTLNTRDYMFKKRLDIVILFHSTVGFCMYYCFALCSIIMLLAERFMNLQICQKKLNILQVIRSNTFFPMLTVGKKQAFQIIHKFLATPCTPSDFLQ